MKLILEMSRSLQPYNPRKFVFKDYEISKLRSKFTVDLSEEIAALKSEYFNLYF